MMNLGINIYWILETVIGYILYSQYNCYFKPAIVSLLFNWAALLIAYVFRFRPFLLSFRGVCHFNVNKVSVFHLFFFTSQWPSH